MHCRDFELYRAILTEPLGRLGYTDILKTWCVLHVPQVTINKKCSLPPKALAFFNIYPQLFSIVSTYVTYVFSFVCFVHCWAFQYTCICCKNKCNPANILVPQACEIQTVCTISQFFSIQSVFQAQAYTQTNFNHHHFRTAASPYMNGKGALLWLIPGENILERWTIIKVMTHNLRIRTWQKWLLWN